MTEPSPNPRETVPYLKGQLDALQGKYNRLHKALFDLGHDPDAIAKGVVIGERREVSDGD